MGFRAMGSRARLSQASNCSAPTPASEGVWVVVEEGAPDPRARGGSGAARRCRAACGGADRRSRRGPRSRARWPAQPASLRPVAALTRRDHSRRSATVCAATPESVVAETPSARTLGSKRSLPPMRFLEVVGRHVRAGAYSTGARTYPAARAFVLRDIGYKDASVGQTKRRLSGRRSR